MEKPLKPFTNNIIFFDSEFSSLNPYKGEILSIGMIKFSGEKLYLELNFKGEPSDWVKENILHSLKEKKVSREKAIKLIYDFVGKKKPHLFAYVPQFDIVYSHKLFKNKKWPFHPFAMDLASMLFAHNIDPNVIVNKNKKFFDSIEINLNEYNRHHALEDARLLRDIYLKLSVIKKIKK